MEDFFTEMFKYTFHFNKQVFDLLKGEEQIPEKSLKLLNHTLNAHEIWNTRILQKTPVIGVWDVRPFEVLEDINVNNYKQTQYILKEYGFKTVINYKTSNGKAFQNTVQDILFHVVNHSTYHRGQIATDCKLHDITPLISDYIFFKRGQIR